jgi:hypothetical protein
VSNDLTLALSTLGDNLAAEPTEEHSADFRLLVEGAPRNLTPLVGDEIYSIAAEALRNAFRHADAARIEVEVHFDAQQLRLRVRDNGKGIDPQVLEPGGSDGNTVKGYAGADRKLLGKDYGLGSRPGTEAELSIPAAVAYANQPLLAGPCFGEEEHDQIMTANSIRILAVDDHPLFRGGIAALLATQRDMSLVAEASNGPEAVQRFREHRPDITLMDLQMPGMNGLDALTAIRGEFPERKSSC